MSNMQNFTLMPNMQNIFYVYMKFYVFASIPSSLQNTLTPFQISM